MKGHRKDRVNVNRAEALVIFPYLFSKNDGLDVCPKTNRTDCGYKRDLVDIGVYIEVRMVYEILQYCAIEVSISRPRTMILLPGFI